VLQGHRKVAEDDRITVLAGTFDTIRIICQIEESKETDHYEVFGGKTLPGMMICKDFPDGTSSELVGNN
jgi:hypothetical protein